MKINPIIPILILSAFSSYIPHINYPYPLHVDEWFHITTAEEIIHQDKIDLYNGEPFHLGMEPAWHLMLAAAFFVFPPLEIYVFLIMALSAIAAYSAYLFAKRYGERVALISAFLVALIPSNVTIGGPSLLVPVNLSLIFIPLALKFAFGRNYLVTGVLTTVLLYAHPPSAVVLLLLLVAYAVLEKEKNLFLVIFASVVASLPNYISQILQKGAESASFPFWVFVEQIPSLFGYITIIFFIAGFYMLTMTKEKENWAIIITMLLLLLDIFVFNQLQTSFFVPYQRIFVPMMLFMSVIAAYSLAKVKNNAILGLILIAILVLSVQHNFGTEYYHIVGRENYDDFVWIKENMPADSVILADPLKSRAIPAITGMRVFTVLPFGPDEEVLAENKKAIDFFKSNCTDTDFLERNDISVVYSPVECRNADLVEVRRNMYVMPR